MPQSRSLKYWIGQSASDIVDLAVAGNLLPRGFPAGLHLEYDLQRFLEPPVRVIIDAGANVGDTALRFARFFGQATVHCFEPVGNTFQKLEQRTGKNPRIILQKLALGDREMRLNIKLSDDPELNSILDLEIVSAGTNSEMVRVVRLDQYAETQKLGGIDLLKMDLEGFELQALTGASGLLEKGLIKAVYAECGFVRTDRYKTYAGLLDECLTGHGFVFSGFYQTFRWGPDKRWSGFSNGLWLRP
jgi:FkbM family methyltransferase